MSKPERAGSGLASEARDPRGEALLALARESVTRALAGGSGGAWPVEASTGAGSEEGEPGAGSPWLEEPGATFVTLMKGEELRGCVGSLSAHRPLREDVWDNALAAAFHDHRFPPLIREELPEVRFEVSLLTPAVPLPPSATESEAIARLRTGRDGVVLEMQGHRATYLPQVWEQIPDPKTFLASLKHKAGLPKDFWSPEIRLSVYGVEKWKEAADPRTPLDSEDRPETER